MKNLFFAVILLTGMLTIYSCKKAGCTDPNAKNYNSKDNTNDGSCIYQGNIIFWWNQVYTDSAQSFGIPTAYIYINGTLSGTGLVSSTYWNSPPSCSANGSISFTEQLGSLKSQVYNYLVTDFPGTGDTLAIGSITVTGNGCSQIQLPVSVFY